MDTTSIRRADTLSLGNASATLQPLPCSNAYIISPVCSATPLTRTTGTSSRFPSPPFRQRGQTHPLPACIRPQESSPGVSDSRASLASSTLAASSTRLSAALSILLVAARQALRFNTPFPAAWPCLRCLRYIFETNLPSVSLQAQFAFRVPKRKISVKATWC